MNRKPRADSLRNRESLILVAKAAFSEQGADVPLEEIARRAGLGVGTFYRHFPTRTAILAAVYEREVDQLAGAADELLAKHGAGEALEAWLQLFVDYIAAKRVLAPALISVGEGARIHSPAMTRVGEALERLLKAARADGDIRPDIQMTDMRRLLVGLTHGTERPTWEPSARRLVGVVMAGLRTVEAG